MSASLSLPWCLRSRFDEISLDSSKPMSSPHCPNLDVHTPRIAFASAIQRQFLVYGPSNSCSLRLLHGSWLSIWDCHRTWCRSVRGSWFPSLSSHPEAAKIVNLHFPLIYIFARIYIPNLRKLKGKCKFYIFPKNVFFRRKIEDLCKNENFHFFLHTKNYYFVSISLVSSLDFWSLLAVIVPWTI